VTHIISWKNLLVVVAMGALVLVLAVSAFAVGGAVEQNTEQQGESGEVDQAGEVTGSGTNSNQCVGLQGTANTGNAQNDPAITEYRSRTDEFNLEEVSSAITEDGTNETTCEQGVDQGASASGGAPSANPAVKPAGKPAKK
jgi:hypothetical protein